MGRVVDVEGLGSLITLAQVAQHLGQQHALDVTLGSCVGAVGAAAAQIKSRRTAAASGTEAPHPSRHR